MDLDSAPSFGVNHQHISLPGLLPARSAFHLDRRAHAERLALRRATRVGRRHQHAEPAGPRRPPFAPGQRESERASRLSSPNRLDSQALAFPGQRERRDPVPQRALRTGSRPALNGEPFFSRRQPTARVGKQKPPRSDPRGLRRFSPELRALRALRVSRRCSRGCSQRAPSERDERRVGQLSRSLSCPVGREKRRGV